MYKYMKSIRTDKDGYERKPPPSYFYLNWSTKTAEWRTINNTPPKCKFSEEVKWKDLKDIKINICTNHIPEYSQSQGYTFTDNPYSNVSYLKSHLQKCVRRSDVYRAIKTANHLMDLDINSFLRRLCIIAIEDSLPLQGFSVIVWFTAAVSKGYKMSDTQRAWCLGYVKAITECSHYDPPSHDETFNITKNKLYRLSTGHSDLIYSLQFRKSYGGMHGDKTMLNNASKKWVNRTDTLDILKSKIQFVTPPEDVLHLNEWNVAAIDFHCCHKIIHSLEDKYEEYGEDDFKKAIWYFSSSVTNKIPITKQESDTDTVKYEKIWHDIRKNFNSLAKFYLKINC